MMTVLLIRMPFRRRSRLGTQVHSTKHVIDSDGTLLATGVQSAVPIGATVVQRSGTFNPGEIELGHTVNGMFVSVFVIGATGAPIGASVNWYIIKTRSGQVTLPQPDAVGTSEIRSQVFHQEKGLAGSGDGTAMAFKGVIVIPKAMRRAREGDQFFIVLSLNDAATGDANFCVRVIYKSFD